jgi:uncharacterized MnhB-related membrane protein
MAAVAALPNFSYFLFRAPPFSIKVAIIGLCISTNMFAFMQAIVANNRG